MTAIEKYINGRIELCHFEHWGVTVSDLPFNCIRAYDDINDLLETMSRYPFYHDDTRVNELRAIRTNLEQLEYIRAYARATRAYYARFE